MSNRPGMDRKSRMTVMALAGAAFGMLALSFAAEPLYSTFCRITGFGGTTQVATKAPDVVLDRTVRVRFDANLGSDLPFEFKASQPHVDIRVGEKVLAFYEVTNTSEWPVKAMAAYNVAPYKVGKYFEKMECFCFQEKIYQPGQTERLPVVFFVSPDIARDRTVDDVKGITLSYTYYVAGDAPAATAQLEGASLVN